MVWKMVNFIHISAPDPGPWYNNFALVFVWPGIHDPWYNNFSLEFVWPEIHDPWYNNFSWISSGQEFMILGTTTFSGAPNTKNGPARTSRL